MENECEVKHFESRFLPKLSTGLTNSIERCQLIANTKFGHVLLANKSEVHVINKAAVHQLYDSAKASATIPSPKPSRVLNFDDSTISHIGVSCDHLTLAVCTEKQMMYLVDVRSLDGNPAVFATTSITSNCSGMMWNPGLPSVLALATCTGGVSVWDVKGDNITQASSKPTFGAASICWSSKGKQLAVGTTDGKIFNLKPSLDEARCTKPPSVFDGPAIVRDIFWISTFEYLAVYECNGAIKVMHVQNQKDKNIATKYTNYDDIFYSEPGRSLGVLFCQILPWSSTVLGCSRGLELCFIGAVPDKPGQFLYNLDEGCRAEMPYLEGEPSYPVGMCVDYNYNKPTVIGEKSVPASPVLLVLTSSGVVCPFKLLNFNQPDSLVSAIEHAAAVPPTRTKSLIDLTPKPAPAVPAPVVSTPAAPAVTKPSLFAAAPSLFASTPAAPSKAPGPSLFASTPANGTAPSSLFGAKPAAGSLFGAAPIPSLGAAKPSLGAAPIPSPVPLLGAAPVPSLGTAPAPSPLAAPSLGTKLGSVPESKPSAPFAQPTPKPAEFRVQKEPLGPKPSLPVINKQAMEKPVPVSKQAPEVDPKRAIENQAHLDSIFAKSLDDEVKSFSQLIDQHKAASARLEDVKDILSSDELKAMGEKIAVLQKKLAKVHEVLKDVNNDVSCEKNTLLVALASLEDAKGCYNCYNDPAYLSLLKSKPLDKMTRKMRDDIYAKFAQMQSLVDELNLQLDTEWENMHSNKKATPSSRTIYKTLSQHRVISNEQEKLIDTLLKQLGNLSMTAKPASLTPKKTASPAKTISPVKQRMLKGMLENHRPMTKVVTSPAKLNISAYHTSYSKGVPLNTTLEDSEECVDDKENVNTNIPGNKEDPVKFAMPVLNYSEKPKFDMNDPTKLGDSEERAPSVVLKYMPSKPQVQPSTEEKVKGAQELVNKLIDFAQKESGSASDNAYAQQFVPVMRTKGPVLPGQAPNAVIQPVSSLNNLSSPSQKPGLSASPSLFGMPKTQSTSPNAPAHGKPSLFSAPPKSDSPNPSGLFGSLPKSNSPSLFGAPPKSDSPKSSLFAAPSQSPKPGLFGAAPTAVSTASGLFGLTSSSYNSQLGAKTPVVDAKSILSGTQPSSGSLFTPVSTPPISSSQLSAKTAPILVTPKASNLVGYMKPPSSPGGGNFPVFGVPAAEFDAKKDSSPLAEYEESSEESSTASLTSSRPDSTTKIGSSDNIFTAAANSNPSGLFGAAKSSSPAPNMFAAAPSSGNIFAMASSVPTGNPFTSAAAGSTSGFFAPVPDKDSSPSFGGSLLSSQEKSPATPPLAVPNQALIATPQANQVLLATPQATSVLQTEGKEDKPASVKNLFGSDAKEDGGSKEPSSGGLFGLAISDEKKSSTPPSNPFGFGEPTPGTSVLSSGTTTTASSGGGGPFSSNLFGATPTTGLFSGAAPAAASPGGGLFGAAGVTPAASTTTTSASSGGLFGSTPSTGSMFGSTPVATSSAGSGLFSAPAATGGLFGATTTASSASTGLFSATTTSSSGLFGAPAATTTSGLFGAVADSKPSPFGNAPAQNAPDMFTSTTANSGPSVFGAPQPSAGGFGAISTGFGGSTAGTGAFGNSNNSGFGSSGNSAFGSNTTTSSGFGNTGQSAFGGTSSFGSAPAFDSTPAFGAQSGFGASAPAFGNSSSGFGATTPAFGTQSAFGSSAGFGSGTANSGGGGVFGSGSAVFGGGAGGGGGGANTFGGVASGGGGVFGGGAAPAAVPGFGDMGNQNAGGFLGGNNNAGNNTNAFGATPNSNKPTFGGWR